MNPSTSFSSLVNPFAVPPFLAALLNVFLLIWVYSQAPRGLTRRTFLLWNTAIGFWNISIAIGYCLPVASQAMAWDKATIPLAISFTAPLFLHFVLAVTDSFNPRSSRVLWLSYLPGIYFTFAGTWGSALIRGMAPRFWGYYPVAGWGVSLFGVFFFGTVGYAFFWLIQALRRLRGYHRNQIEYLLLGAAVGFGSGATNFLPLFGVNFYPIGNLLNSVYTLLVAYAIVEYGLMDIRLILRRGAVYAFLTSALTVVYLSMVSVFKRLFAMNGVQEAYLYYTAAVPVTVILAPAMKARIEPFIERASFWKTYRYSEILHDFGQSILTLLDLRTAASRVVEKMSALLLTDSGAIYLSQPGTSLFVRTAWQGIPGPGPLDPRHPVVAALLEEKGEFVKEKALWQHPLQPGDPENQSSLQLLKEWPYALALPLLVKDRLLGLVVLGEKASGDMFNEEDINLLKALAALAAVALGNAQAIEELDAKQRQMERQREMAIIGTLVTEMAHELNKPLTHIMNEGSRLEQVVEGSSKKNLKKIGKEAQRAAEILDGFAMLSPSRPLQRVAYSIKELLEEAVTTLGLEEGGHVRVIRQYEDLPPIPVNPGQLVQVFTNVLQNAWQAMPETGTLTLSLRKLNRSSGTSDVEVAIADSGPGIPTEIQDKVFEPFFTTKQHQGGRGVGLTISRAMVERHGGSIRIESPVTTHGGTRVVIRLPILPHEDLRRVSSSPQVLSKRNNEREDAHAN